jgi:hypothetical protein
MCGKIKIPLRKLKNDQKNFPLARKRAREQKFPHPQTAYNLRKNGARHPLTERERERERKREREREREREKERETETESQSLYTINCVDKKQYC